MPMGVAVTTGVDAATAGLAVILLTDEDDQSPQPVTQYVNDFEALKGDPDKVAISGVYGLLNGCSNPPITGYPGPRIADAVALSGGAEWNRIERWWSPPTP